MATFGSLNNTNVENGGNDHRFVGGVMSSGGTLTDVAVYASGWAGGAKFRVAVYQGGTVGDPTGATLVWQSNEITDTSGTAGWRSAVSSWGQTVSGTLVAGQTWIFVKNNDGNTALTNADKGDWASGSERSSVANTPSVAFAGTVPSDAGSTGAEAIKAYLTYTVVSDDTTPDAFSFTDQNPVALSTVITSNTLTVAGIDAPAAISVTGGEYQINGGSWTTSSGTISNGDTFAVRGTSSSGPGVATNVTLTIGGVADTFTFTTAGTPIVVMGGRLSSFP